jgi:guanidinoacetate N-methyltransferase
VNPGTATIFGDVRDLTRDIRIDIGFPEREAWRHAPAYFDEHTLMIEGHPVMEDWEDGYMHVLADIAASQGGTVLEVGFGMGISARHIQSRGVDKHLIIEANEEVYAQLEMFAQDHPSVVPLLGFWEEVVETLPSDSVDGILFDTYPLAEEDIHRNHFPFFTEAARLLKPDGVLTYYSDEIDSYSDAHLAALRAAGFSRIDQSLCRVSPPSDCEYWKSRTLLAPIVRL